MIHLRIYLFLRKERRDYVNKPNENSMAAEKGFLYINSEHKIRIPLSRHAYITMLSDMSIFDLPIQANFINRIIMNYKDDAIASLSTHLKHKHAEYQELFASSDIDPSLLGLVIDHMLLDEKNKASLKIASYLQNKEITKLYHINNENMEFLTQEFDDSEYYRQRPGSYVKALLEEYSQLSFIEREKIVLKETYEIIDSACAQHKILKIKTGNPAQTYTVYPYKIISDPLNVQDYLVCYSQNDETSTKKEASFSLLRIKKVKSYSQSAFLSKNDIARLENSIAKKSVAFFVGDSEKIVVRLTSVGKEWYQRRLYNRPEVADINEARNEYLFYCPEWQARMYFLPFGENAEILQPSSLREEFRQIYEKAYFTYRQAYNIT